MGAVIIPVVTAMFLGGTFDLRTYQRTTGNEIFDPKIIKENTKVIDRSYTSSTYKLVETSTQAREFLEVSGELALRIKNRNVDIKGIGSYLQDDVNRQNYVELLIRVQHETVTETIPSHLPTLSGWMSAKNVGTHYVRSITYGGELVASFRLKAKNTEEREIIKAAVSANLQLVGSFDLNANGSFNQLRQDLVGMYDVEIKLMSTTRPQNPPETIEDLMKIVEMYPKEIGEINNGLGNPLRAELYSLSSLKADYFTYFPNTAMNNLLDDVEAKFDDVRTTSRAFHEWYRNLEFFDDNKEERVNEFYDAITKAQKAFSLAIAKLDVSSTGDISQFSEAFELYGTGSNNIPYRFSRWFWRLRTEITKEPIVWKRTPGSGVVYVNWGSKECPANSEAELLHAGYASGSLSNAWNGGRDYLCLPQDEPKLVKSTPSGTSPIYEQLIAFRSLENAENMKFISCATCFIPRKISVETFIAMTACPEKWTQEYSGYLMADSSSAIDRNFMCLNKAVNDTAEIFPKSDFAGKLNAVWMSCDSCNGEKIVPCIVCVK